MRRGKASRSCVGSAQFRPTGEWLDAWTGNRREHSTSSKLSDLGSRPWKLAFGMELNCRHFETTISRCSKRRGHLSNDSANPGRLILRERWYRWLATKTPIVVEGES